MLNHEKVTAFTENAYRLGALTSRDRVSFLSASPSAAEEAVLREWAEKTGVECRYFARKNRGIDQLARLEYLLGVTGSPDNLDSQFMFMMQDHYLDTTSPWSHWDARFDFAVKEDVVPDGMTFDLDAIEARMESEGCVAAFADRKGGCWIEMNGSRHIAPSGGNFIVRTNQVSRPEIQPVMRHLMRVCDNTYWWALYVEFMWGALFFREGYPVLDLRTNRVIRSFPAGEFYVAPDDFPRLHRVYGRTFIGAVLRSYYTLRRTVGKFVTNKTLRKILGGK